MKRLGVNSSRQKTAQTGRAGILLLPTLSRGQAGRDPLNKANRALRDLNEKLSRRNRELAALNRSLHHEVAKRQRTETALRESQEYYQTLFNEARQMQDHLRHISTRVLHIQEEERKRISRELHDQVGQALTAIHVHLAVLRKGIRDRHQQPRLADTQRLLAEAMEAVHHFSRELRPAMLDELGLVPALRSYIRAFAARTGIRASLRASSVAEKLGTAEKLVLYRVAQESLTNVAKHAHATRVKVNLRREKGRLSMEIVNNGKALQKPAGTQQQHGLGLLGIQERVQLVQGDFQVTSAPGRGMTVRVCLPFR